ncbi:MAG: hypothetical protein LHW60_05085 [Candidatus Cloacimonetes bacterium]|jgi:hypothetical protein|nr:hypothetical protein [Candidatus Cloacimonadota bacterium]NLO44021.1 hypothetical protein [Candidatus Cloacimonadota bacterium]
MPRFDRMEWPRKYKLKGSVLLLVLLAIAFGFWLQKREHSNLAKNIEITDLNFDEWGTQHIQISYTIENKSKKELSVRLLAKVWDADDEELSSVLFDIEVPPMSRQNRSKLFDRLNRVLKEGEAPHRANIVLYPKKRL